MLTKRTLKSSEYARLAYNQDKKTKQFLENSYIYNKTTGLINKIEYNSEWHLRQSYLYNTFRIDYLNQECIENGMIPIFVTLTLPGKYHPTSPQYDNTLSVNDGYQKLQEIFRNVYNNFRIDRKKVSSLKFVRVIEPHKSWIPHLHAIVYVPSEYKDLFLGHLERIINNYELKQTDIKELETAKHAVTYLLKYIDKTLSGEMDIRGWKIYHEIKRSLTMSNLNNGITRNVFKKLSSFVQYDKENKESYLHQILKNTFIKRYQVDNNKNIIRALDYGNPKASFVVKEVIQKTKKIDPRSYDYDVDEMLELDENEYKFLDLKIYKDKIKVYDKEDYVFYRCNFVLEPEIEEYDYLLVIESADGSEKLNL